jgi:hypothetical protein
MAFGLTIGTERATALQVRQQCLTLTRFLILLQNAVQDELTKRGYSMDAGKLVSNVHYGLSDIYFQILLWRSI